MSRVVFEDVVPSVLRMKNTFLFTLFSWAKSDMNIQAWSLFLFFGGFDHHIGAGLFLFPFSFGLFFGAFCIHPVCFGFVPFFLIHSFLMVLPIKINK